MDEALARRVDEALTVLRFTARGALITDLDGTAVHQQGERVVVLDAVQGGLERIRLSGRPVIINTLRFPLSVMRTFGPQWMEWTLKPLPCVTLNGSLIGDLERSASGDLSFRERAAFPLWSGEIEAVFRHVDRALGAGADRFSLFIYPRDWRRGELIWTPVPARAAELKAKYVSATDVLTDPLDRLHQALMAEDLCLLSLQIERLDDPRLAFQHGHAMDFVTRPGIDKRSGAVWLCNRLAADHAASIGAGDTELDTFLDGIGLGIHVGGARLAFRGRHDTLRLPDPAALGSLLHHVAAHCEQTVP